MKECFECKKILTLSDFSKDLSKKDGKSIYCRYCLRKRLKRNRKNDLNFNKKRQINRKKYKKTEIDYALKYRYGISLEEKNRMLELQNNQCKICKSNQTDQKSFAVDHCHKTGKIRSLLCGRCNRTLGIIKEDINILKAMIEYIKEHL